VSWTGTHGRPVPIPHAADEAQARRAATPTERARTK
jgi:hypothetical protein